MLAGDLDTGRIAHEAIGNLLGAADLAASGAPVVMMAEEQRRRERQVLGAGRLCGDVWMLDRA